MWTRNSELLYPGSTEQDSLSRPKSIQKLDRMVIEHTAKGYWRPQYQAVAQQEIPHHSGHGSYYKKDSMVKNIGGKSNQFTFHNYHCTRTLGWRRLKEVSPNTDSTDPAETTNVCYQQLLKTKPLLAHGLQHCWLWWYQYCFVERDWKNSKTTEKLLGFIQAWKKPDDCTLWLLYSWDWRMRNLNWLDRTIPLKHTGMHLLCSTMHLHLNIEHQYNILKNGY